VTMVERRHPMRNLLGSILQLGQSAPFSSLAL